MKKNMLKDIENIKQERKLSKETEKIIKNELIAYWAIGISFIILIMVFQIAASALPKNIAIKIYNVCSIELLIFTIVVFEVAYKKDNGKLALCGVETLVISIFTLFAPYVFYVFSDIVKYILIAVIDVYYIIKIIATYCSEKKKYLLEKSDITEIIKKESQDNKAEEEKEKILKKIEKNNKENEPKEKTQVKTRKTKTSAKEKTKTNQTTKKTTTRGRPKKTETAKNVQKEKQNKNDENIEKSASEKKTKTTRKKATGAEQKEKPQETASKTKKTATKVASNKKTSTVPKNKETKTTKTPKKVENNTKTVKKTTTTKRKPATTKAVEKEIK